MVSIAFSILLIWIFTYLKESNKQKVPVLMYHKLVNSSEDASNYCLPVSEFENQLAWFKKSNFNIINLNTLVMSDFSKETNKKFAVLTFDDGKKEHYLHAFKLLKQYGYTATFFVISNKIDRESNVGREDLLEMSEAGMSIESHTHTHRCLELLRSDEIIEEYSRSKNIIESITEKPVNYLCIPAGYYSKKTIKLVKETGYKAVCTSDVGTCSLKGSRFMIKRIHVPGTITIEKFSKLFSPTHIAFDNTYRQIRLVFRKIIGHWGYQSFRSWFFRLFAKDVG